MGLLLGYLCLSASASAYEIPDVCLSDQLASLPFIVDVPATTTPHTQRALCVLQAIAEQHPSTNTGNIQYGRSTPLEVTSADGLVKVARDSSGNDIYVRRQAEHAWGDPVQTITTHMMKFYPSYASVTARCISNTGDVIAIGSSDSLVFLPNGELATSRGLVAVITRSSGSGMNRVWSVTQVLTASDAESFGWIVAMSSTGDFIAIASGNYPGSVHVFARTSGIGTSSHWSEVRRLVTSDEQNKLTFLNAVGISADGTRIFIGRNLNIHPPNPKYDQFTAASASAEAWSKGVMHVVPVFPEGIGSIITEAQRVSKTHVLGMGNASVTYDWRNRACNHTAVPWAPQHLLLQNVVLTAWTPDVICGVASSLQTLSIDVDSASAVDAQPVAWRIPFRLLPRLHYFSVKHRAFQVNLSELQVPAATNLTYFDVSGTELSGEAASVNLSSVPHLRFFDVSDTAIVFTSDALASMISSPSALAYLSVSRVLMATSVDLHPLNLLPSLVVANFSHNRLTSVFATDVSFGREKVTGDETGFTLDLSFNNFARVSLGWIACSARLRALLLHHCWHLQELSSVDTNTTCTLERLEVVDASHSRLNTLHPLALAPSPQLKRLNVSHANITSLDFRFAANLSELTQVDLRCNPVHSVVGMDTSECMKTRRWSSGTPRWTRVDLSASVWCGTSVLHRLSDHALCALGAGPVEVLLRDNALSSFSFGWLSGLSDLAVLDLHGNLALSRLEDVDSTLCERSSTSGDARESRLLGLHALKVLDVSGTSTPSLRDVGERALCLLGSLERLNMSGTAISVLPQMLLSWSPKVRELDLSRSRFQLLLSLHHARPSPLPVSFSLLHLNVSSVHPVAELPARLFSSTPRLQELLLRDNGIQRIHENAFAELRQLLVLDLSDNRIDMVHPRALNGLTQLRQLLLTNNPISDGLACLSLSPSHCYIEVAGTFLCSRLWPGSYCDDSQNVYDMCRPGSYCNASTAGRQVLCPAGSFSATEGSTSCSLCPAGFYSGTAGATSCTACETGRYASEQGSSVCVLCPAGRYAPVSVAATSCERCSNGTVQSLPGQLACAACPKGTFAQGTTSCDTCPLGTYADNSDGSTRCTSCPAGSACPLGATAPVACPLGGYSASKASVCSLCPAGRFAVGPQAGFTVDTACEVCPAGRYAPGAGNLKCVLCPAGFYSPVVGARSVDVCVACNRTAECPAGSQSALSVLGVHLQSAAEAGSSHTTTPPDAVNVLQSVAVSSNAAELTTRATTSGGAPASSSVPTVLHIPLTLLPYVVVSGILALLLPLLYKLLPSEKLCAWAETVDLFGLSHAWRPGETLRMKPTLKGAALTFIFIGIALAYVVSSSIEFTMDNTLRSSTLRVVAATETGQTSELVFELQAFASKDDPAGEAACTNGALQVPRAYGLEMTASWSTATASCLWRAVCSGQCSLTGGEMKLTLPVSFVAWRWRLQARDVQQMPSEVTGSGTGRSGAGVYSGVKYTLRVRQTEEVDTRTSEQRFGYDLTGRRACCVSRGGGSLTLTGGTGVQAEEVRPERLSVGAGDTLDIVIALDMVDTKEVTTLTARIGKATSVVLVSHPLTNRA